MAKTKTAVLTPVRTPEPEWSRTPIWDAEFAERWASLHDDDVDSGDPPAA